MGRRRLERELQVAMNGFAVGRWSHAPSGVHRFRYETEWLDRDGSMPISLSMPLSPEPFTGPVVWNFFDNLLPDDSGVRRRLQARLGVATAEPFDLLASMGADCVGALQIHPLDRQPPDVRRIDADPIDDATVAETLRLHRERPLGIERDREFRISIAGAQEKTALLRCDGRWMRPRAATPTSHILKLPMGAVAGGLDLSDSVENEWLCLRLAAAFGLPVASAEIGTFVDQRVLVVERFDRRWAPDGSWLTRVPQEDFCQALGVSPGLKYESDGAPGVAQSFALLERSQTAEQDRRTFYRALLVYWLLAAIDGHAKNFSVFLLPGGRHRLTPLYDVLSVYPMVAGHQLALQNVKMAMALLGQERHAKWSRILPRHWLSTAEQVRLPAAEARAVIDDVLGRGVDALTQVHAQVPADFPQAVAEPILAGVERALRLLRNGLP